MDARCITIIPQKAKKENKGATFLYLIGIKLVKI